MEGEEGEEAIEEEEEEAEEEEIDEEPQEPEEGPPLLTPLSEDLGMEELPSWKTRLSSKLVPEFACAVLESNAWPGAYAIANDKMFENVYIGWGQKFTLDSFNPAAPFDLWEEYILKDDTELVEVDDPTPAQEEAWMKLNAPNEDDEEEEDEEEEEEEEREGDDDEDEDDKSESIQDT